MSGAVSGHLLRRCFAPAVLTVWLAGGLVVSRSGRGEPPQQGPAVPGSPTASARQQRLTERNSSVWEARRLAELSSDEAIAVARRVLAIQRGLSGDSHPDVANALEFLAEIAQDFARFEESGALPEFVGAATDEARGPPAGPDRPSPSR